MLKRSILFLVITISLSAKSPLNIIETDRQIVFYTFNHQFDKAEILLDQMIRENPGIPKYYFLNIVTASMKHLAEADDYNFEERYEYRKQKNLDLIKYTEGIVEKFEDLKMTTENKYYMANIHGYLGRLYGFERSYMSAFGSAKKGKVMLEEIVQEHPDLYDAYLLLGMFEYYADRMGGFIEFVAGILGFSGDRNTGIKYLKIAHEKGDLTTPFAAFILGETYSLQESNYFDAKKYFSSLIKKFPNNSSFYDWYVRILLSLDQLKEAEKAIDEDKNNFVTGFTKAQFYFNNGELEKAKDLFKELIDKKEFKWGFAYNYSKFLYAATLLLLGEPVEEAEKDLGEFNREVYLEVKNNIEAARAVHAFTVDVGRMKDDIEINLTSKIDLPEKGYLRSLYEFTSGQYLFKMRDYFKAEKYFQSVGKVREYYKDKSVEYLIEMYKRIDPTEKQLEVLEDIVNDIGDDDLEFSFMGLRK